MAYELTIKKNGTFKNAELNLITSEMADIIQTVGAMKERAQIQVARHLSTIANKELYKDDGYESAVEFAIDALGMSKANAYAYVQVGNAINEERVPLTDASGNEFNFSQLRALCSVKSAKALQDGVDSGAFSANRTTAEIEEEVKAVNPQRKVAERKEKRYIWEEVGCDEATADCTKTELLKAIADNGGDVIGELKDDEDFYIVAISQHGAPLLYRRGNQVTKVVESK